MEANTPEVKIIVWKDASHIIDLLTRRSVAGIMIFVKFTLVKTYSKSQNMV